MKSKMNGDVNEFSNPNQGWKRGGEEICYFMVPNATKKKVGGNGKNALLQGIAFFLQKIWHKPEKTAKFFHAVQFSKRYFTASGFAKGICLLIARMKERGK